MHAPYKTLEIAPWRRKSRSKPIDETPARVQGQRLLLGKRRVGQNALKHGLSAKTIVLPHEDAEQYQHRRLTWKRELGPLGDLGDYLAEQLVTISWQLDRANIHERARLAHQISKVPKDKARAKTRRIDRLMVDLLHEQPEDNHPGPTWSYGANRGTKRPSGGSRVIADPAVLIGKLEASLEGCRRLLAEWTKLRDEFQPWLEHDVEPTSQLLCRERVIRMLGHRADQVEVLVLVEPKLAVVVNALKFVNDIVVTAFWAQFRAMYHDKDDNYDPPRDDPSEEPAPSTGPTPAQHKAALRAIIDEECTRLSGLVARFEAEADETDDEHEGDEQDQLAFDDSPEGDRLHRYQAHWSRSLLRTIEAIARLKKRGDGGEPGDGGGEPDEPPLQVPPLMDSVPSVLDSTREGHATWTQPVASAPGSRRTPTRFNARGHATWTQPVASAPGSRRTRARFNVQGHATGRQDWNLAPRRGNRAAFNPQGLRARPGRRLWSFPAVSHGRPIEPPHRDR